jgi:tetratricopeptide (TPR) repeat protein
LIITPPSIPENKPNLKLTKVNDSLITCENSWLKKNSFGLWELYIEGNPYERGLKTGMLTKNLIEYQEIAFVKQILKMVPSRSYLDFLKYFIAIFNRNLDKNIPLENLQEMYGISKFMSNKFSFISPGYMRILNYHAAHDIGHALVTYHMVGCTSFAVKNEASADSSLLIARNFDFYVGDEFAENKIVTFFKPDSGYKFMFVTWGGMIGVCSGMNEKGLTITINAGTSDIPYSVATPISIVARNILQYAGNIEEAKQIALKFKTFVSESILIGSAADNDAINIEKTPSKQAVFVSNKNYIICTNHFQSDSFVREKNNIENMLNSSSLYRYFRVKELILQNIPITPISAAKIMRDKRGINNTNIGIANEKSINQLIAHHSIIFLPKKLKVWVSTSPYQLGSYLEYDLNKIFNDTFDIKKTSTVYNPSETINADPFLYSKQYKSFVFYKLCKDYITKYTKYTTLGNISKDRIKQFERSNPNYYYTWQIIGDYYKSRKQYSDAINIYNKALKLEITTKNDRLNIEESIAKCIVLNQK